MSGQIATPEIASEAIAGSADRNPPAAAVTSPSGTIDVASITVAWTYSSPLSRAQTKYRVTLATASGLGVYDSGEQAGAVTSFAVPFILSDSASYIVAVYVFDGYDWGSGSSTILTSFTVDTDVPVNSKVGSVYEIAINGVGQMLADNPGKADQQYRRQVIPLDPPRFATGDTPFSQAIDRYTIVGISDFSAGAGQRFLNRDISDARRFKDSYGVDPFTPGELTLLRSTVQLGTGLGSNPYATVASDKLFVYNGSGFSSWSSASGSPTTFTVSGMGTVSGLTSDGLNWYACDGANVYRNTTAADPGAAWSTENVQLIAWCSDRIMGAYASGGSTPNRIADFTDAGVATTAHTFPVGTTIRSITSGDGYAFWAADRASRSAVYAWQLGDAAGGYTTAFELPAGQQARSVAFYQGNVFIRAREARATGSRAIIYRCAANDGKLTPSVVLEIDEGSADHGLDCGAAGTDRFFLFGWEQMLDPVHPTSTDSGVGAIDLSSGGWARWLSSATTSRPISVVQWLGKTTVTYADGKAFVEQSAYTTEGVLYSSVSDLSTVVEKVYDDLRVMADPLPEGTIEIGYSLDGGNTFLDLPAANITIAGETQSQAELAKTGTSIAVSVKLTGDGSNTPTVRGVTARCHPIGQADEVLVLPVQCSPKTVGLNGQPIPELQGGQDLRARQLMALAQTRIRLQDVDYPVTNQTQIFEVIAADLRSVGVMATNLNRQDRAYVVTLTLRRAYK